MVSYMDEIWHDHSKMLTSEYCDKQLKQNVPSQTESWICQGIRSLYHNSDVVTILLTFRNNHAHFFLVLTGCVEMWKCVEFELWRAFKHDLYSYFKHFSTYILCKQKGDKQQNACFGETIQN